MKMFEAPPINGTNTRLRPAIAATIFSFLSAAGYGQQQQTQTIPPVSALNSQYVQGISPGYTPSAGSGLTLNIAPGTAHCNGTVVTYPGGTLAMSPNTVNYVYLDAGANCAPAVSTNGFELSSIPVAEVATAVDTISSITDDRTWFGTGLSVTNASIGVGTMNPSEAIEVASGNILTDNGYFYAYGTLRPQVLLNAPERWWGDIQNDLGNAWSLGYKTASNPYLGTPVLSWTADNRVGIGNVTTPAQTLDVNGSGRFALNTVSFSGTPTFDASLGNTQRITLAANVTSSTLLNASAGEFLYFIICQDASGNRTFSWPTNLKGGMTIGATAGTCSAQSFIFDGNNAYALTPGVTNQ